MQLCDVRDYIRSIFPEAEHFQIGRIDGNAEKCIGIYSGEQPEAKPCFGKKTYDTLAVSVLVYWAANAKETDAAAKLLYDRLEAADFPEIGGHTVPLIALKHAAPQDCTRPGSPVYERVIEAEIYYNL